MRISGGEHRGRLLRVPRGVRPTGGRVREALFSIWSDRLAGARFLDLFAGSGGVGLEALSRGAQTVVLVERSASVLEALEENRTQVGPGARVVRGVLPGALGPKLLPAKGLFDLAFADPPYAFEGWNDLLSRLAPLLASEASTAIEHSVRRDVPETVGELEVTDRREYGESVLTFYSRS